MEFLAGLYTLLLVAICLLQALLLHRTGKPATPTSRCSTCPDAGSFANSSAARP